MDMYIVEVDDVRFEAYVSGPVDDLCLEALQVEDSHYDIAEMVADGVVEAVLAEVVKQIDQAILDAKIEALQEGP